MIAEENNDWLRNLQDIAEQTIYHLKNKVAFKSTTSVLSVIIRLQEENSDKMYFDNSVTELYTFLLNQNLSSIKHIEFYGKLPQQPPIFRASKKYEIPSETLVLDPVEVENTKGENEDLHLDCKKEDSVPFSRKAYQFVQVRVQLLGRGMTNEIMSIYVNGKRLRSRVNTLHEFLSYLGLQGFRVVTAELETEGIYTHFYILEREVLTSEPPSEDIFKELAKIKEGADFGDAVRNFLEGGFDRFA